MDQSSGYAFDRPKVGVLTQQEIKTYEMIGVTDVWDVRNRLNVKIRLKNLLFVVLVARLIQGRFLRIAVFNLAAPAAAQTCRSPLAHIFYRLQPADSCCQTGDGADAATTLEVREPREQRC